MAPYPQAQGVSASGSSSGGSDLGADVITYIGVPLAVLGILPIVSTCLKSLLTLRQIRHLLSTNHITSITRSSLLSGIIEVEIPRKSLCPPDRNDPAYFSMGENVSHLKGGSWTHVNWKEMNIGTKNIRVQYHDELKQPQAEVELESLVAYLLDLGAVPDPQGWEDLRNSGLWTPAGTRLMLAPGGDQEPVLFVTSTEDSDGILSLGLFWRAEWAMRSVADLPPSWMRISAPAIVDVVNEDKQHGHEEVLQGSQLKENDTESPPKRADTDETLHDDGRVDNHLDDQRKANHTSLAVPQDLHAAHHKRSFSKNSVQSGTSARTTRSVSMISFSTHISSSIRFRLGPAGLVEACYEDLPTKKLKLHHLTQTPYAGPDGSAVWFASAATALGSTTSSLWSYTMPSNIIALVQKESVPGGVLVLLDFIEESTVPAFRQPHDDKLAEHEEWVRQQKELQRIVARAKMSPEEMRKNFHTQHIADEFERREAQRRQELEAEAKKERDLRDALSSQRVSVLLVAEAGRKFLIEHHAKCAQPTSREHDDAQGIRVEEDATIEHIVSAILWEMIKSAVFAHKLANMLDMWRDWAEGGGMTKTNFEAVQQDKVHFAYSACILGLIYETAGSEQGSVISDLQDCLRMWKKVRLG